MQLIMLVVIKIYYTFFPSRYFFLASSFSTTSLNATKVKEKSAFLDMSPGLVREVKLCRGSQCLSPVLEQFALILTGHFWVPLMTSEVK